MKILLDECVHRKMKTVLPGHAVSTVSEMEWSGIVNGKLLALASTQFDVFITVDKNLQFQQNLSAIPLSIIAIHSKSLRWEDVSLYIARIASLLESPLERKLYELS